MDQSLVTVLIIAMLGGSRFPRLSPKFALVTLLFLIAGLGTGALASTVLGS